MTNRPILLVEDNPDDELLTLRAFEQHKILNKVIVARDGAEALELLFGRNGDMSKRLPEDPALVLLDIKLPKVDGIEVLRQIRAREETRMLRVVMLTSSKEERDLIATYSLGVDSYVQKPVDFYAFVQAVKEIGSYWMLLNEVPPTLRGRGN